MGIQSSRSIEDKPLFSYSPIFSKEILNCIEKVKRLYNEYEDDVGETFTLIYLKKC